MNILILCLMLFISVQALENITYPNVTTITGKHKEAYAFLLCTRPDAKPYLQGSYDAVRVHTWRLQKLDPSRDIIILACEYTPNYQYYQLQEDGAIVIPVKTIQTTMKTRVKKWQDVNTKLLIYKLIGWERIFYLDIDIFFFDNWMDIWNQTANHFVTEPPKKWATKMDEEWYGVKIRDLFPYQLSACIDTGKGYGKSNPNWFNSGLLMVKPSLAHFTVNLNVANADVNHTLMMDQGVLNVVYSRKGPMPWTNFSEIYNIFPWRPWSPDIGTNFTDFFRGYHYKIWDAGLAKTWPMYRPMYALWVRYNETMYAERNAHKLLHPNDDLTGRVSVTFPPGGIILTDKRAYSTDVTVYAIITQGESKQPNEMQIKNGLDASNRPVPMLMQTGSLQGFRLMFNNFSPDKKYKLYYVKYNKESDKFSPVGAIQFNTTN